MAHLHDVYEPDNIKEAVALPQWKDAMQDEYNSIMANNTRELVPELFNQRVIGVKWLFKVKICFNVRFLKIRSIIL